MAPLGTSQSLTSSHRGTSIFYEPQEGCAVLVAWRGRYGCPSVQPPQTRGAPPSPARCGADFPGLLAASSSACRLLTCTRPPSPMALRLVKPSGVCEVAFVSSWGRGQQAGWESASSEAAWAQQVTTPVGSLRQSRHQRVPVVAKNLSCVAGNFAMDICELRDWGGELTL